MKFFPALMLVFLAAAGTEYALAEQGTFVDGVRFIQYLDEGTALEEVKNGNLDLYYYRIPSDRIESPGARADLQVFDSTGGSYSILVNPAESEKFNPFSIREVRFALNHLVDRELIVNELMGGFGTTMISNYGPFDPDYLAIIEQVESFHFQYNPALADGMISDSLYMAGAERIDGSWFVDGEPVAVSVFIRSDDPVRKSIGEILASELEGLGFSVKKDYGDLNKAFVVVYGSDPADLRWSLYTEGWGGRSAFVKYDSLGLGQMYAPWFSNMPGSNDPSYWNYENDRLDSLTQKIYTGNFSSSQERAELIQDATVEGVRESVRIFLASKVDQYVAGSDIKGVINDLGTGVPSRFTPINSRGDSDLLTIGVKQIYQGAWNPVMGLSDSYSAHIWNALYDPGVFRHPYTGESMPVRSSWDVETAGPGGKLAVPADAIIWNPQEQRWDGVAAGSMATSRITFDLIYSDWHHGEPMDINDVMYSLYFTLEWGSEQLEDDKTFDAEFTPRAAQIANTMIGIRPVDADTVEVYVDYWHFDEAEIAAWASVWSEMPWEIYAAMEQAVLDGKTSFSRSGASSKGVNWLSLIVSHDAMIIHGQLELLRRSGEVPAPLEAFVTDPGYPNARYDASLAWIESNDHAIISNGPFYLERYSPESYTIQINAFADDSYPFESGFWGGFEAVEFPGITQVSVPDIIHRGAAAQIPVATENASDLYYFFTSSDGSTVSSGVADAASGMITLSLSGDETALFGSGANDLKLFALSDDVLRPYVFAASFLAVDSPGQDLPVPSAGEILYGQEAEINTAVAAAALFAIAGGAALLAVKLKRGRLTFPR